MPGVSARHGVSFLVSDQASVLLKRTVACTSCACFQEVEYPLHCTVLDKSRLLRDKPLGTNQSAF